MLTVILLFSCLSLIQGRLVIQEINLSDAELDNCKQLGDTARSNQAAGQAAARALREYMTRNHVKIVVDKSDVVGTSQRYPNEGISTGHSCKVTAQAQSVVASVAMVPGSVALDPAGVVYLDEVKNSIAVADVKHSISVRLDVRVWGGFRFFGRCKKYARKTCSTDGYAEGTNRLAVNLAASNTLVECVNGEEHLTFNLDASVVSERNDASYPAVQVGRRSGCNIRVLGVRLFSINSKIQSYASRYVRSARSRLQALRGPRLVAELEKKLGVHLGSTVHLKVKDSTGAPRTC